MQVDEYDIKIGFFKCATLSEFTSTEEVETKGNITIVKNAIHHSMSGKFPYENIIDYKNIEKIEGAVEKGDVCVNYAAQEPGFYRIVFSNAHSWMRKKTVLFRYSVLAPLTQPTDNEPEEYKEIKVEENKEVSYMNENLIDIMGGDEPAEITG